MKAEEVEHEDIVDVVAEEVEFKEETTETTEKGVNLFKRRKDLQVEFTDITASGVDLATINRMKLLSFYWASGLLPAAIKTPEEAVIVDQYGQELGFPADSILSSFDLIALIKNKPGLTGAGLAFMIRKAGHGFDIIRDYERLYETRDPRYKHALGHLKGDFIRRNEAGKIDPDGELTALVDKATTIGFYRKGDEGNYEKYKFVTFTDIDAKLSELDKEPTYRKYPSSMYFWKCLTHGAKQYFSEVIKGVNLPEIPADIDHLQVSQSSIEETPKDE